MKNNASKAKRPVYRKWWFWLIAVVILAAIFGNTSNTAQTETHLYDNAQVKDVMNGLGTEKIGEYSFIEAEYDAVTAEALTDWYFNYVAKNDYNWCMILYTDKGDNSGVYSIRGIVQKDVVFTKEENGDYSVSDTAAASGAIVYIPTGDNTLEEVKNEPARTPDKISAQNARDAYMSFFNDILMNAYGEIPWGEGTENGMIVESDYDEGSERGTGKVSYTFTEGPNTGTDIVITFTLASEKISVSEILMDGVKAELPDEAKDSVLIWRLLDANYQG